MTSFDRIDFQRIATAVTGALVLSTACVGAAFTPARAAEAAAPLSASEWQADVERQIDANLRLPERALRDGRHAVATVGVRFDGQGGFDGATIVRSTGVAMLDEEALRTARSIRYPTLRGAPRTVAMQLYFGVPAPAAAEARDAAKAALAAYQKSQRYQTASLPRG